MPELASRTADVGGVPFHVTDLDGAVTWAIARASKATADGIAVRLANAHCVNIANERPDYLQLLQQRGINFPDGAPVAWAMRKAGEQEAGRVRGPSFFTETLDRSQGTGLRHYFFGTDETVLAELVDRVHQLYPGAVVVGASAPDFRSDPAELAAQLPADITKDMVDIVWVGLGSPKQDFVADVIAAERGVMTAGVGAAFDFVAGSVREAPKFVQDSGMEWAFRLLSEPRRLWRRYLIGNVKFLRIVLPGLRRARAAQQPSMASVAPAGKPALHKVR
jgi:N-acetylglucosaminyldiphosphoundecaprenol N-acetyl-beta-D-mannosaminyltransferase